MKHAIGLFILLFSITMMTEGQNVYYDAQVLRRYVANNQLVPDNFTTQEEKNIADSFALGKIADSVRPVRLLAIRAAKKDSVFSILIKYKLIVAADTVTATRINTGIRKNPFLLLIDAGGMLQASGKGLNLGVQLGKLASTVGGLDVTNIANGIADLLIDRAKQELTVAFFDRFKKFSMDNPEFALLFPKTTDNLAKLLTYSYPQMLPALRDGFLGDLKQITFHLDDVLALPRYQQLLQNFPEVRLAIRSLRLVSELETGASNAAEIIKEFAAFPEWTDGSNPPALRNAGSYLQIASLVSESIRNDSSQSHTNTAWVSAKELKALFNDKDKDLFTIYMALLYQQSMINDIKYVDVHGVSKEFKDILAAQKDHIFLFRNKLQEFFELATKVDATFIDIHAKRASGLSPTNDDYYNYINMGIDVVDYGFSIAKIFTEIPVSDDFLGIARKSNDIYKDIYTKQYTQAMGHVVDVFGLIQHLVDAKIDFVNAIKAAPVANPTGAVAKDIEKLAKGDKMFSPVTDKNIENASTNADAQVQVVVEHYRLKQLLDFIDKLKPYALFMANMVEATNEDAVKAALENVILPVGSSSIKKSGVCNVSVQAYLGAYWTPWTGNNSVLGTWTDKYGVLAPIGISWTPSWLSWKKAGSLSLFGSLFDVGAIVDYKLKKDPSATGGDSVISKNYSVKLGQLFSPGAYVVYGAAWNLPLAVGFGGQYGPGLSKINVDGVVATNPTWRWNVFIAVDLPFFNLVNKKR